MYIYIGTNTVNNKQYVGQSQSDPLSSRGRITTHSKAKENTAIHRAIRKYGFHTFTWEVIYYPNASQNSLNAIERWQISKNNSLVPNGYNLMTGGGHGGKHVLETRRKQSHAHKGVNNPMHKSKWNDKPHPNTKRKGENNPFFGKHHSEETLAKKRAVKRPDVAARMKGESNPMKRSEVKEHFSKKFSGDGNPMCGKTGNLSPRYGMKHTKEAKDKMSEKAKQRTGTRNPNHKTNRAKRAGQLFFDLTDND